MYKIRYKIEPGEFTKEQVREANCGGCHAIIIHSIMFGEDGSRSELIISADGRTKLALSGHDLFQSWMMLAHKLSEHPDLGEARRALAGDVFESYRQMIMKMKLEDS